jgi:phenylpropionate dioxygenase-like ring-hydroxylating dioxygenase large terminal subunit
MGDATPPPFPGDHPMRREWNRGTQPFSVTPGFNDWDTVPEGWYLLGKSDEVRVGAVRPYELCRQRVVVFRGADRQLRALDAFCPHMGTDLAIGAVVGNDLRCFFHHWRFAGDGRCVDIPCGDAPPTRAKLQSYDVRERYGFIWIWPGAHAAGPVPAFPELEEEAVYAVAGRRYERSCHQTVCMINGLDAQHLRTVHRLPVALELEARDASDGRVADYRMSGPLPVGTTLQRLVCWLLGGRYAYRMRYVDATVGLLSTLEEVRWFGRFSAEPTRMIFAYTPLEPGRTQVQPIYIARRPTAWWRRPVAFGLLFAMALGFRWLRDEDGKVYDNIRFQPNALLPIDQGVARFIAYAARLKASIWSRAQP